MNSLGRTVLSKAARSRIDILRGSKQILLTNVPRTATPEDIRREVNKAGAQGVSDIALDYEFFRPTERAILTLLDPDYLQPNLTALKNLTISGIPISSDSYVAEIHMRPRMRGLGGREKAAQRGALTGDGPNAGMPSNDMTVTMSGLPARTKVEDIEELLKDYRVARARKGLPLIVKLPLPPGAFSMTSRFIIVLASVAEAHRLVRKMHATYLNMYGEENLISAKVIS